MTEPGQRIAHAAAAMIGTRFRLHGRHPQLGLDCVGLVVCSLNHAGFAVGLPSGYRLRNSSIERFLIVAGTCGFAEATGASQPGDILLCEPGPAQHHLLIVETPDRFIHADAGLGKVTRIPAPLPWSVVKRWRKTS